MLTPASGTTEREAPLAMLGRQAGRRRATLGADKGYDAQEFGAAVRALNVTPHITQNTSRRSAIDRRTTGHPGYAARQRLRKQIEGGFRLDQDHRRLPQDPAPRHRPGRLAAHAHRRRLQPGAPPEAAGGDLIIPAVRLQPGRTISGPSAAT